jgi:tight adherence protein B
VGLLPTAYVLRRRQQRLARLYAQLPDALDMMARALRAGHAFSSALQMAAQELGEPLAGELRLVHEEVRFGLSLQQALGHLVERAPLTDLRYFVVAVLIQRESGGNLAEVMGKLAQLIRARQRLLSRVRVLSSEGRLSAWILVVLPFALAGLLAVFNPQFISPLWTDPIGIGLLKGMLVMMAIGVFLMVRIVRIRV